MNRSQRLSAPEQSASTEQALQNPAPTQCPSEQSEAASQLKHARRLDPIERHFTAPQTDASLHKRVHFPSCTSQNGSGPGQSESIAHSTHRFATHTGRGAAHCVEPKHSAQRWLEMSHTNPNGQVLLMHGPADEFPPPLPPPAEPPSVLNRVRKVGKRGKNRSLGAR